jgi:hypothetical protein
MMAIEPGDKVSRGDLLALVLLQDGDPDIFFETLMELVEDGDVIETFEDGQHFYQLTEQGMALEDPAPPEVQQ